MFFRKSGLLTMGFRPFFSFLILLSLFTPSISWAGFRCFDLLIFRALSIRPLTKALETTRTVTAITAPAQVSFERAFLELSKQAREMKATLPPAQKPTSLGAYYVHETRKEFQTVLDLAVRHHNWSRAAHAAQELGQTQEAIRFYILADNFTSAIHLFMEMPGMNFEGDFKEAARRLSEAFRMQNDLFTAGLIVDAFPLNEKAAALKLFTAALKNLDHPEQIAPYARLLLNYGKPEAAALYFDKAGMFAQEIAARSHLMTADQLESLLNSRGYSKASKLAKKDLSTFRNNLRLAMEAEIEGIAYNLQNAITYYREAGFDHEATVLAKRFENLVWEIKGDPGFSGSHSIQTLAAADARTRLLMDGLRLKYRTADRDIFRPEIERSLPPSMGGRLNVYEIIPSDVLGTGKANYLENAFLHPEFPQVLRRLNDLGFKVTVDASLETTGATLVAYHGISFTIQGKSFIALHPDSPWHVLQHELSHLEWRQLREDNSPDVLEAVARGESTALPFFEDPAILKVYRDLTALGIRDSSTQGKAIDESMAVERELQEMKKSGVSENSRAYRLTKAYALAYQVEYLARISAERRTPQQSAYLTLIETYLSAVERDFHVQRATYIKSPF